MTSEKLVFPPFFQDKEDTSMFYFSLFFKSQFIAKLKYLSSSLNINLFFTQKDKISLSTFGETLYRFIISE